MGFTGISMDFMGFFIDLDGGSRDFHGLSWEISWDRMVRRLGSKCPTIDGD